MERMLRVFTVVLVITVFAGMAMEMAAVIPPSLNGFRGIFSGIPDAFRMKRHERKTHERPVLQALPAEKDRRLSMSPGMISQLRTSYGKTINEPGTQLKAVEKIEQYLESEFPRTWKERKYEALSTVFPDQAQQLFRFSRQIDDYNAWLDADWGILLNMKRSERNQILWNKRQEIFGGQAREIWKNDTKDEAVYTALEGLDKDGESSLKEKVTYFVSAISQAYGGNAEAFMKDHRQDLLDGFLGLDSVQGDLQAMQPSGRRESLKDIRKALGMGDAELLRWDTLEKARDERWNAGLAYMKERRDIAAGIQGENRERILDELRKRYFGPNAEVIAHEEEAGFLRFNVKRVYGKN